MKSRNYEKRKRKICILVSVIGVLLLAGGGGLAAYFLSIKDDIIKIKDVDNIITKNGIIKSDLEEAKLYTFVGNEKEQKGVTNKVLYIANENNNRPTNIPTVVERGYSTEQITNNGYKRLTGSTDLDGVTTEVIPTSKDVSDMVLKTLSYPKTEFDNDKVYLFTGASKIKNEVTDKVLYLATTTNTRPTNVPNTVNRGYTAKQIEDNGYVKPSGATGLNGVNVSDEVIVDLDLYHLKTLSVLRSLSYLKTDSILKSEFDPSDAYTVTGTGKTLNTVSTQLLYKATATNTKPSNVPTNITTRGYTKKQIEDAGYLKTGTSTNLSGVTIKDVSDDYNLKTESILKSSLDSTKTYVYDGTNLNELNHTAKLLYIAETDNTIPDNIPTNIVRGYTKAEIEANYVRPSAVNDLNGLTTTQIATETDNVVLIKTTDANKIFHFKGTDRNKVEITPNVLYKADASNNRPTNVPVSVSRGYSKADIEGAGYLKSGDDLTGLVGVTISNKPTDLYNLKTLSILNTTLASDYIPKTNFPENVPQEITITGSGASATISMRALTNVWVKPETIDEKIASFDINKVFAEPTAPLKGIPGATSFEIVDIVNDYLPDYAQLTSEEMTTILANRSKYKFRIFVGAKTGTDYYPFGHRIPHRVNSVPTSSWNGEDVSFTDGQTNTNHGKALVNRIYDYNYYWRLSFNSGDANGVDWSGKMYLTGTEGSRTEQVGAIRGLQVYVS